MASSPSAAAAEARDAGLRRMKMANRGLIGAMIALTIVLAEAASHAFRGHSREVRATTAVRQPATDGSHRARHRAHRSASAAHHHRRVHAAPAPVQPPARAPSATTSPAPQSAPTQTAPTATAPSAPAPSAGSAPAPAPATSGGS